MSRSIENHVPLSLIKTGHFNDAPLGSFVWPSYSSDFETGLIVRHGDRPALLMLEGERQHRLFYLDDADAHHDYGSWVEAATIEIDPVYRFQAPDIGSVLLLEDGVGFFYRDRYRDTSHDVCFVRPSTAEAFSTGRRTFGYRAWQIVASHDGRRIVLFDSTDTNAGGNGA